MSTLSQRGDENLAGMKIPWRFAPSTTYDKITNPDGLISFATAENGGLQQELENYVAKNVRIPAAAFTYAFSSAGGPLFPTVMATFLNTHFHPYTPLTAANILTSSGVTPVANMLALNLGDAGDGILVSPPIYGRFELDFGNEARLKIVYAEMKGVDGFAGEAVGRLEVAVGEASRRGVRVRAVLISNPSNPLGQCYPRSTLRALLVFCNKHKIHLVSDEVYALSVFDSGNPDAAPFTSVLSIDTTDLIDPNYVHAMYGLSKDFGAAGLRIGCLITRNIELLEACTSLIRFHSPSGPSIALATALLSPQITPTLLLHIRTHLSSLYAFTTATLSAAGINYRRGTNAGLFLYVDLSPYLGPSVPGDERGELSLAAWLLERGVFLHPGEERAEEAGWFRLVFAREGREVLGVGLGRLIAALKSRGLKLVS